MGLDQRQFAALRHHRDLRRDGAPAIPLHPSRAQGPMVVEFIGISGTGKTTLCSAIVSELRRDGFTIITIDDFIRWTQQPRYKKIGAVVASGIRTWYFGLHVYCFLHYCTSLRGRDLLSIGYELTCMQVWLSQTISSTPPHVLIILDGLAWPRLTNWLRYLPDADLDGSQFRRIVSLFYPRCDVHLICKTTAVDLAVQRISERRRLSGMAPRGIEEHPPDMRHVFLCRQTHLYESICDALRFRYGDKVSYVDGTEPIPQQVRYIKSIIAQSPKRETSARPPESGDATVHRHAVAE